MFAQLHVYAPEWCILFCFYEGSGYQCTCQNASEHFCKIKNNIQWQCVIQRISWVFLSTVCGHCIGSIAKMWLYLGLNTSLLFCYWAIKHHRLTTTFIFVAQRTHFLHRHAILDINQEVHNISTQLLGIMGWVESSESLVSEYLSQIGFSLKKEREVQIMEI